AERPEARSATVRSMTSPPHRRMVLQGLAATALAAQGGLARGAKRPRNVLFISIDDLNDWVGILGGHQQARTPNITRLSRRGVSFENAHCAAPACNPSRTAVLTGIRPSTSGVYGNNQAWRPALPEAMTLPQMFRRGGYRALGAGKVFHFGDPRSWDRFHPDPCGRPRDRWRVDPTPSRDVKIGTIGYGPSRGGRDGVMSDYRVARFVEGQLARQHDRPFFLACGFFKPHLPWHVPQKYYEMYPLSEVVLPVARKGDLEDVPAAGRRMARVETHRALVRNKAWRSAVQGYLAALSFADAMLGRVLDALDASEHRDDTLVVLWSDHGWSLGEKFHWKKFALWEECTRVPLVIGGPGIPRGRCARPVNLVDLYPTLADLCGLEAPRNLDGVSLAPLVADPNAPWSGASLTTHGFGNHAVRDERWRYIRYADGSEELYDHSVDPEEWHNLASRPDTAEVKATLAAHLPGVDASPAPGGKGTCRPR
ncbi:MAG: sulfatase, partial [Myxococcota bacterium]|nr:sulfatase [Myxococcota bacterium]